MRDKRGDTDRDREKQCAERSASTKYCVFVYPVRLQEKQVADTHPCSIDLSPLLRHTLAARQDDETDRQTDRQTV